MKIHMMDYLEEVPGGTRVVSQEGTAVVPSMRPFDLLDRMCLQNGSDLSGAVRAGHYYLRNGYKVPVRIHGYEESFFFPTAGMRQKDCVWLAGQRVRQMEDDLNGGTVVTFYDGNHVGVKISLRSAKRLWKRCGTYAGLCANSEYWPMSGEENGNAYRKQNAQVHALA